MNTAAETPRSISIPIEIVVSVVVKPTTEAEWAPEKRPEAKIIPLADGTYEFETN
jgi:hypothetical protein